MVSKLASLFRRASHFFGFKDSSASSLFRRASHFFALKTLRPHLWSCGGPFIFRFKDSSAGLQHFVGGFQFFLVVLRLEVFGQCHQRRMKLWNLAALRKVAPLTEFLAGLWCGLPGLPLQRLGHQAYTKLKEERKHSKKKYQISLKFYFERNKKTLPFHALRTFGTALR